LFQSTRPRGARLGILSYGANQYQFQSTRPRGARQKNTLISTLLLLVSIHAPAWGATAQRSTTSQIGLCFNPRARVGRDPVLQWFADVWGSFNPRARVGRDCGVISTKSSMSRFNPRARVGRDAQKVVKYGYISEFQSTRPRGARQIVEPIEYGATVFQSTRPRGARPG